MLPFLPVTALCQHQFGSILVLYAGRVDYSFQQQTLSIYKNVTLASIHLLACIVAAWPPFSEVLTDWLSMTAALGSASLPSRTRSSVRSVSLMRCHTPVLRHFAKCQ